MRFKLFIRNFKLKHPIIFKLILPALLALSSFPLGLSFPSLNTTFLGLQVYVLSFLFFLSVIYLIKSRNNKNWLYWIVIFGVGGGFLQVLILILIIVSSFEKTK